MSGARAKEAQKLQVKRLRDWERVEQLAEQEEVEARKLAQKALNGHKHEPKSGTEH